MDQAILVMPVFVPSIEIVEHMVQLFSSSKVVHNKIRNVTEYGTHYLETH